MPPTLLPPRPIDDPPAPAPEPAPESAPGEPAAPEAPVASPCPNCGAADARAYCPDCGQAQREPHRSLRAIAGEALDTLAGWDGKIPRTLWTLVRHPGRLTADYVAGQRARYLSPLRLYVSMGALLYLAFQAAEPRMRSVQFGAGSGASVQVARGAPRAGVLPPDSAQTGVWQKLKRSYFGDRIRAINRLTPEEQEREVSRAFFARAGTTFFVLLPVFALLVSAVHPRAPHAYAEHLVFVLHAHAFAAGALALGVLVGGGWGAVPLLAVPPYAFVALRRVYGGSRRRTLAKLAVLGAAYLVVLLVGLVVTALVAFFVG